MTRAFVGPQRYLWRVHMHATSSVATARKHSTQQDLLDTAGLRISTHTEQAGAVRLSVLCQPRSSLTGRVPVGFAAPQNTIFSSDCCRVPRTKLCPLGSTHHAAFTTGDRPYRASKHDVIVAYLPLTESAVVALLDPIICLL